MKWNIHVDDAIKRASRTIFLLVCMRRCNFPVSTLWRVYEAMTRSIITYAFPVLCNMSETLMKQMAKLEKRAILIIGCHPTISIRDYCKGLCCRLMHDVLSNAKHPLRVLFDENKCKYNLRGNICLRQPPRRTARHQNSFVFYLYHAQL